MDTDARCVRPSVDFPSFSCTTCSSSYLPPVRPPVCMPLNSSCVAPIRSRCLVTKNCRGAGSAAASGSKPSSKSTVITVFALGRCSESTCHEGCTPRRHEAKDQSHVTSARCWMAMRPGADVSLCYCRRSQSARSVCGGGDRLRPLTSGLSKWAY